MSRRGTLVWFRQDLRLADNPALQAAVSRGGPVVPVYIWSPEEEGAWPPGAASRWWLHHSLASLATGLKRVGAPLIIRRGPALKALLDLGRQTGAKRIVWNRRYEPSIMARDQSIKGVLQGEGYEVESFNAALLREPWAVQNRSGKPFQVFTPFWKTCLAAGKSDVSLPPPAALATQRGSAGSLPLESLELLPRINWAEGLAAAWHPGEAGARSELDRFLSQGFDDYDEGRNRPDLPGTSRLSPHLHFGEISPRQVWEAVEEQAGRAGLSPAGWQHSQFVTELGWREFAHHLLFHFPFTPEQPLRSDFSRFPWRSDAERLRAWQRGQTGVPLVDAGMRQLWSTGWMHNRVRMVAGSFLVKNLLIPWPEGARWFWDTLVDADLAGNTLGWQWTAGCGADAAPFFRIFNPVSQGQKFDPEGRYVRRWVPELQHLPDKWIHQPWAAPPEVLRNAGVRLGTGYPEPVASLYASREVALAAYQRMRSTRSEK